MKRDWLFNWRNRLLADPKFQAWASRTPIAAKLAKKEANAAFDLCAGFVYSQVLLACVKVKLLDVLSAGPVAVPEIAARTGLPAEGALRLLKAAAALRLVEARGDNTFGLGRVGAALRTNPGVLAMVEHHEIFYADLKDPVALLKGEASSAALGKFWGYASGDGEVLSQGSVAGYTRLMGASNALVASQVLDAYPFAQHRVHLDIGGGDGTFVTAVAVKFPALTFKLFDLPAVAEVAKARIHAANLDSRIEVFGGSFLSDALPRGADIITLLRIIHDHNDEPVRQLLRASRAALQPGGILLIAEPMSDTAGSETVGDAYFGFYLMAMGSGEPRSAAKISSMVMDAGFQSVREVATHLPMQARLLVATA